MKTSAAGLHYAHLRWPHRRCQVRGRADHRPLNPHQHPGVRTASFRDLPQSSGERPEAATGRPPSLSTSVRIPVPRSLRSPVWRPEGRMPCRQGAELDRDPVARPAVGIVVELRRAADLDVAQRLHQIERGWREPRIAQHAVFLLPRACWRPPAPVKPIPDRRALEAAVSRTVLAPAVFGAPGDRGSPAVLPGSPMPSKDSLPALIATPPRRSVGFCRSPRWLTPGRMIAPSRRPRAHSSRRNKHRIPEGRDAGLTLQLQTSSLASARAGWRRGPAPH